MNKREWLIGIFGLLIGVVLAGVFLSWDSGLGYGYGSGMMRGMMGFGYGGGWFFMGLWMLLWGLLPVAVIGYIVYRMMGNRS
ncbi:MAG: hypothetical protein M0Z31_04870 [Clostridia bacterium]|nr:hypothetical protein [Clostridia bacterium]